MQYVRQAVDELVCSCETRDPYCIARYLGTDVHEYPFRGAIKGMVIGIAGRVCIAINSALPMSWKRFVLAHEIGHLQLSVKGAGYFFLSEHTLMLPLIEREANLFAVELLVGDEEPYRGETVKQFAARVGVPAEMMEYWVAG